MQLRTNISRGKNTETNPVRDETEELVGHHSSHTTYYNQCSKIHAANSSVQLG
jgi:hypothetical protein